MSLEIITGGMFSGKTEELLRRLRRVQYANLDAILFRPRKDDRYDNKDVVSHSDQRMPSVPITQVEEIWDHLHNQETESDFDVFAIDEVQFLEGDVVGLCRSLATHTRIIVAGLDMNSDGDPWPPIPELMAIADRVDKLRAICVQCGRDATFSHFIDGKPGAEVVVGGADKYEARCRWCFHRK